MTSKWPFSLLSGQIIATSHDRFPPKGSFLEGKSPAISGKPRLVKYYSIWPELSEPITQSFIFGFKMLIFRVCIFEKQRRINKEWYILEYPCFFQIWCLIVPIGSMGLIYLPTWMVDFYGINVAKYTIPMDPLGYKFLTFVSFLLLGKKPGRSTFNVGP